MLKKLIITSLLAILSCMTAVSALAQDSAPDAQQAPPAGGPPEHGRGHFDPVQRTEMLTKKLNLTSDQQSKVLDVLKSEQSQMEKLHSDSSLSQDDRRAKMMDIHKTSNEQIRGLLDSDQQAKWDKMQSERGQRGEHHQD
jgi:periplasmic protein CpxP/Spy